ncbi:MAG: hypothetical protein ACREMY_32555, partial [bacterium]
MTFRRTLLVAVVLATACHSTSSAPVAPAMSGGSRYLFLWAGDADKQESDFLAVVDVNPRSPTYASVISTLPVGVIGSMPHHTEYEMSAQGILWA